MYCNDKQVTLPEQCTEVQLIESQKANVIKWSKGEKVATNLSVQQASKLPEMKMEQVSGPTQEYKVINHPRMPGQVVKGYETKTTFHQRDKKKKKNEKGG